MDWKDTLSALKDSGAIPSAPEEETSGKEVAPNAKTPQKAALHVLVEKKGRGGKTATIIEGWEGDDESLHDLAKTLKQKLGTGGSARGGEILIQGDRRDDVKKLLNQLGYKTKG